jgi:hypothetical protein
VAKKPNNLSSQGHRVMGALATYLVPKLGADQSLQSAELESVCKSVVPARYDKQLDGIIGTVKERFSSRLAADQNLDDLRKVLLALTPLELANDEDGAEDEDDDSNDDSNDALPLELKKNAEKMKEKAAKDKKAKDSREDPDDDGDDDTDDSDDNDDEEEDEEEGVKGKDKKAKDAKRAKDAQAHDAAITKLASDATMYKLASLYEAAAAVKPVVGEVNVLACDSAADIYEMGLKAKKIAIDGMPRASYKHVFNALMLAEDTKKVATPRFAQDAATTKTLAEKYPNMPALG